MDLGNENLVLVHINEVQSKVVRLRTSSAVSNISNYRWAKSRGIAFCARDRTVATPRQLSNLHQWHCSCMDSSEHSSWKRKLKICRAWLLSLQKSRRVVSRNLLFRFSSHRKSTLCNWHVSGTFRHLRQTGMKNESIPMLSKILALRAKFLSKNLNYISIFYNGLHSGSWLVL